MSNSSQSLAALRTAHIEDQGGEPLPFPGETLHGPAPRPGIITDPAVHRIGAYMDPYDETQTSDEIEDGDVLVIEGTNVVAVMVAAWPVAVRGDGEDYGFHGLAPDADIRTLGADRWGRLFTVMIHPTGADPYPADQYMPLRGGNDYSASWALARAI